MGEILNRSTIEEQSELYWEEQFEKIKEKGKNGRPEELEEMREIYRSGKTKDASWRRTKEASWRRSQLRALLNRLEERKDDMMFGH
ncbi:unnamed protein product [Camellia sinensis]